MAGVAVTFDLSQLPGLSAALGAAIARLDDLEPLMDQIGNAMETTTHERFETERGPDGTPWTPTIRSREEGGQILRLDGHLDNSVTHRASADSVEVGSNLIYARIHQQGGTISAKSIESVLIPARPYLGIGGDDEETILELTSDYVLGELGE